jgi:alkanesulfonate monooxygenase SsuD/methylene tetrahydromethanopterin reductase-like flavin-dependent oxidoreductase (luciferase family)
MQGVLLEYSSTEADGPVSLRFHWFANRQYADTVLSEFREMVSTLDSFGYYSVLLPYHNHLADFLILSARDVSSTERIKYNIAIRPSEISAEACARQVHSFNKIESNRLMLNIIYGSPEQIEGRDDLLKNRGEVKQSANEFIERLSRNNLVIKSKTEIIVSGNSYDALEISRKRADYSALDLESFEREEAGTKEGDAKLDAYASVKRLMLVADIVVTDNKDTEKFKGSNSIVGTEKEVIAKLKSLQGRGVTDIMVAPHPYDQNTGLLHKLIKHISS